MKLYELSCGQQFRLTNNTPDEVFTFVKIDGMYSICKTSQDDVVHFAAWTDVQPITDGETNE